MWLSDRLSQIVNKVVFSYGEHRELVMRMKWAIKKEKSFSTDHSKLNEVIVGIQTLPINRVIKNSENAVAKVFFSPGRIKCSSGDSPLMRNAFKKLGSMQHKCARLETGRSTRYVSV